MFGPVFNTDGLLDRCQADIDKQLVCRELLQLPAALAPLSGLRELKLPQLCHLSRGVSVLTPAECYSILDGLAGLRQLSRLAVPLEYRKGEAVAVGEPGYRSVLTFVSASFAGVLARDAL